MIAVITLWRIKIVLYIVKSEIDFSDFKKELQFNLLIIIFEIF